MNPHTHGSVEFHAYANGLDYALSSGATEPLESPLSGEWADGVSIGTVVVDAWADALMGDHLSYREAVAYAERFWNDPLEDHESILEAWENGYRSHFDSDEGCILERTSLGSSVICVQCGPECECYVCKE